MTPEDLGRAIGSMESSLQALHEKIDEMVLPSCKNHESRIAKLEERFWVAAGTLGGLIIAKDAILSWVHRKSGG